MSSFLSSAHTCGHSPNSASSALGVSCRGNAHLRSTPSIPLESQLQFKIFNIVTIEITGTFAVPKEFLVPHRGSTVTGGLLLGSSGNLGSSQNPKRRSSALQVPGLSTQQPVPKILQSLTLHSSSSSGFSGGTVAVAIRAPPLGPQERLSRLLLEYWEVLFGWRQQTSSEAVQVAISAWPLSGGQHSPSEYS